MRPSAARRRLEIIGTGYWCLTSLNIAEMISDKLEIMPTIRAFIPSLGWVELTGGGDLLDRPAVSDTNAGPDAGRSLPTVSLTNIGRVIYATGLLLLTLMRALMQASAYRWSFTVTLTNR